MKKKNKETKKSISKTPTRKIENSNVKNSTKKIENLNSKTPTRKIQEDNLSLNENELEQKILEETKSSNRSLTKRINFNIITNNANSNLTIREMKKRFIRENMFFALNLFVSQIDYSKNDVIKIKQIHHGFTNLSYEFFTSDNNRFQVRIGGSNEMVNRTNEWNVLSLINDDNYLFHDLSGNAVKKWIHGKCPKFIINRKKQIKLVLDSIDKLHAIDIKNTKVIKHNYLSLLESADIDLKHKKKYLELCQKHQDSTKWVLSHNDINSRNIIYHDNKMELIDFEWARINFEYWDVANFFRESKFKIKWAKFICDVDKKYKYQKLIDFIYITTNFALQWTYAMPQSKKILNYRKKVFKKLKYFYKFV